MTSKAIVVFLRVPEKGRVKTRLAKSLNTAFVLELYKGFIRDTLEVVETAADVILYCWPPRKKGLMEDWLGRGYLVCPQNGKDLGQRMANAFQETFQKGYSQVILIGTDIPEFSKNDLSMAFDLLCTTDAVIGPSSDGGYYLIGFQRDRFSTQVFNDIDWSTDRVQAQTIQTMNKESIRYGQLPQLNDVDTPEDFQALAIRVKKGGAIGQRTMDILKAYDD